MPAKDYTVVRVKNGGERPNPHGGGTLTKWYLDLQHEDGIAEDVYSQTKPPNTFDVGDTVYGEVESGEYGLRFRRKQRPGASQSQTNGASGTPAHEYGYQTHPINAERMGRSNGLEYAIQLYIAGKIDKAKLYATAQAFADFIADGRGDRE